MAMNLNCLCHLLNNKSIFLKCHFSKYLKIFKRWCCYLILSLLYPIFKDMFVIQRMVLMINSYTIFTLIPLFIIFFLLYILYIFYLPYIKNGIDFNSFVDSSNVFPLFFFVYTYS